MKLTRVFTVLCLAAGVLAVVEPVPLASAADTFTVSGLVTDGNGTPLTDVIVVYGPPNAPGAWGGGHTDANGFYSFSVAAGVYDIEANSFSGPALGVFIEDVTISADTPNLDLVLVPTTAMTVSGTVPVDDLTDGYGRVSFMCGNGGGRGAQTDVASDGTYSVTVTGPAVTHCELNLRVNLLGGSAGEYRSPWNWRTARRSSTSRSRHRCR